MKSILLRLLAVAICLMAMAAITQAAGVEMTSAVLVDDLELHMIHEPSSPALIQTTSNTEVESEAQLDAEAEIDSEQEAEADAEAQIDAESEAESDAEAEMDAESEVENEMESQAKEEDYAITKCGKKIIWERKEQPNPDASLMEMDAEIDSEAQLDAEAEADSEQEAENDAEAQMDAQQEEASDAEALADAEAEVEAETEAETETETDSEDALVEVDAVPVIQLPVKDVPKVHIHVATKLHGGNADNLLRVEERFDNLHDRVMGRLNKLMGRIDRHPDTIEDKTHAFAFNP